MGSANSGPKNGQVNNPNGRPKGSKNRISQDIRLEFERFLMHATPQINALFDQLVQENPRDALNAIKDYTEFVLPKLQRVEVQDLDKDGEKTDDVTQMLQFVEACARKDTE